MTSSHFPKFEKEEGSVGFWVNAKMWAININLHLQYKFKVIPKLFTSDAFFIRMGELQTVYNYTRKSKRR
jgi:hypothetical protein